jgi:hypothetical protein
MQTLDAAIAAAAATKDTTTTSSFVALLAHMKRVASYHIRNVGSWTGNPLYTIHYTLYTILIHHTQAIW